MERKQHLAIVGASVRAAAQSAIRAGFDVVGADLFADADLDGVCPITKIENYPDGLADWLAKQEVDAWMYTGALENYPDLVDRMAQITPLWGVSGEPLRRCRDPLVLQDVFRDAGVAFPETRLATGEEHREPGWLAKTYRHSNGVGVWPIRRTADAKRAHEAGAYVQQGAAGREYGATFAIGSEGVAQLLGVTETLTNRPDNPLGHRGFLGAVGPVTPGPLMRSALARLGKVLATQLNLRGPIGVDLIGEGKVWTVIEINPRYTASVEVLLRSKPSLAEQLLPGGVGCDRQRDTRAKGFAAKRIVYTLRQLVVSKPFESWAHEQSVKERLADIPRAGSLLERGAPVCTCLARVSDTGAAKKVLEQRALEALSKLYATSSTG